MEMTTYWYLDNNNLKADVVMVHSCRTFVMTLIFPIYLVDYNPIFFYYLVQLRTEWSVDARFKWPF